MKRIIIGTIVGTLIFFGYQSIMWEGGFHNNLWIYSPAQDSVLNKMTSDGFREGVYFIPSADPNSKTFNKDLEEKMKTSVGKPWAMVFYHSSMKSVETSYIILGLIYTLIAIFLVTMAVYFSAPRSFGARFLIAMSFGIFTLVEDVLSQANWWSYPWNFVKPQVVDHTLGWALCCIWLAFYVKKKVKMQD